MTASAIREVEVALEAARSCILGETPEAMSPELAREWVLEMISDALLKHLPEIKGDQTLVHITDAARSLELLIGISGVTPFACPLCGHPGRLDFHRISNAFAVECTNNPRRAEKGLGCGITGPERATQLEAIAVWNHRSAPRPQ